MKNYIHGQHGPSNNLNNIPQSGATGQTATGSGSNGYNEESTTSGYNEESTTSGGEYPTEEEYLAPSQLGRGSGGNGGFLPIGGTSPIGNSPTNEVYFAPDSENSGYPSDDVYKI